METFDCVCWGQFGFNSNLELVIFMTKQWHRPRHARPWGARMMLFIWRRAKSSLAAGVPSCETLMNGMRRHKSVFSLSATCDVKLRQLGSGKCSVGFAGKLMVLAARG